MTIAELWGELSRRGAWIKIRLGPGDACVVRVGSLDDAAEASGAELSDTIARALRALDARVRGEVKP